jgi:hypothetical protein
VATALETISVVVVYNRGTYAESVGRKKQLQFQIVSLDKTKVGDLAIRAWTILNFLEGIFVQFTGTGEDAVHKGHTMQTG